MAYHVRCSCGREIAVASSAAGGDVTCTCGRNVPVPSLSELRQQAGESAFESGIADRIHRLIATSELPPRSCCVDCGRPSTDVAELYVQIERLWMRGPGRTRYLALLLAMLISPFWWLRALFFESLRDETRQELGRDRFVDTPLCICDEDRPKLKHVHQRKLKRLLQTVPIYAELLREYPGSRIFAGAAPAAAAPPGEHPGQRHGQQFDRRGLGHK
jgi:hypothetical protein